MKATAEMTHKELYAEMSETVPFRRLTNGYIFQTFSKLLTNYVGDVFVDLDLLEELHRFGRETADGEHHELQVRVQNFYNADLPSTTFFVSNMIAELNMACAQYQDHCFEMATR